MSAVPHYPIASLGDMYPLELKGTYHHRDVLQAAFTLEDASDNEEFFIDVTLVPEPDNPHSSSGSAISVRWRDRVIGYVPSGESQEYAQLRRVAASGYDAATTARIWSNVGWKGDREFWARVAVPPTDLLLPLNNPPADGYVLLPVGAKIQVTKESDHIDYLADFVPPSGKGQILVSLHRFEAGKTKTWEGVEVRLDGERVGELSKVSSEKFVPTIRHFDDLGLTTLARAEIKGSSIAAEIVLMAARAHELDEDLLATVETRSLPRLIEYEADPNEYEEVPRYQARDSEELRPKSRRESEVRDVQAEESVAREDYTVPAATPQPEPMPAVPEPMPQGGPHQHAAPAGPYGEPGPQSFYAAPAVGAPAREQVNLTVAWVLWVLLGLLGGHRYYLGNIGIAILQTLTIGGLGIWWVIDAFLLTGRVRAINEGRAPRVKF